MFGAAYTLWHHVAGQTSSVGVMTVDQDCSPTTPPNFLPECSTKFAISIATSKKFLAPSCPPCFLGTGFSALQGQCPAMGMWFSEREKNLFAGHLRRDFLSSRA